MTRQALIAAAAVLTLASTAFIVADANHPTGTRGILLIDKVGGQIRFIDPVTYKERAAFKVATNPHDFVLTADRKTAYVPLYGESWEEFLDSGPVHARIDADRMYTFFMDSAGT